MCKFVVLQQDDIIDEVDTLIGAAQCLKDSGAKQVYVVGTHAVLTDNGPRQLEESCIDKVKLLNCSMSPIFYYVSY